MKPHIIRGIVISLVFVPLVVLAQNADYNFVFSSDQEVHIDKNGTVAVVAAKVIQVAGTTLYVQSRFGNVAMRWILPTDSSTRVVKRFGGAMLVSDIAVGDFINFSGVLNGAGDSLNISTKLITDWSRKDEQASFSGVVSAMATTSSGLVLTSGTNTITVMFGPNTTVTKGKLSISLAQIKVGDRLTSVTGVMDVPTKTLSADRVVVYQDPSVFYPQNFQGTLKTLSLDQNPMRLTVTIGNKDYSVRVMDGAKMLNALRNIVSPSRFMIGDTVRLYGNIEQTDLGVIDATIVRNISL